MTTNTQEVNGHGDQAVQDAPEHSRESSAIALHQSGTTTQFVNTIMLSGARPIAASSLEVYGTLIGGRPIEASHIRVVETGLIPGGRPVFASEITMIDADTLPGHRPIAASPASLMHGSTLPGHRPIASNEADDSGILMGYID
jgi:hypothetical protein